MGILACSLLNYVVRSTIEIFRSLLSHAWHQDCIVSCGRRIRKLALLVTLKVELVRVLTNVI